MLAVRFIVVTLSLLLSLVACGRAATPVATPVPQPLTVALSTNQIAPQGDLYLEAQILAWGEEHGAEITFVGGIDPSNPPDCGQLGAAVLPELLMGNALVDITDEVEGLSQEVGGFTDGALSAVRYEGKYWAVPYASSTFVFYVRQDKLEAVGLPLPDTWADAMLAAQAINAPDEFWGWGKQLGDTGDTRTSFRAQLWGYGGSIWDEAGQPAIDSGATREVLEFYRTAWLSGLIPPEATTWAEDSNNQAYQAGKVGMVLNAGSILTYLLENDSDLLNKTRVTLIPAGPAGRFVGGTFLQWGVLRQSEAAETCLDLTAWLFSPDRLRSYYEAANGTYLPTSSELLQDDQWQRPYLKEVAAMAPYTYAAGYPGPTTPWALEALQTDFIPRLLQRVLVDGWSTDEAIQEADQTLWALYDGWQAR